MSAVIEEIAHAHFNASVTVTELVMKTLENAAKDLARRCIIEAATRHGFDADEEIRILGLENLALIRKQMAKKSSADKSAKKEKKTREPKEKKTTIPMPFVAETVDAAGCQGIAYNRGLFTQCSKKRMENGQFCKGCQAEADKNASGCPDCGTVEDRLATGLYDFKDPKGRTPVSFSKVIEKLKIDQAAVLEEAGKLNIEIPEEHFVAADKTKKTTAARGRPKKTGAIEAENVTDLFAALVTEDQDNEEVTEDEEKPTKTSKKPKLTDEEKAIKKAALEAERAAKKAEKEVKLAQEKAEKEAKRKAELEAKKAEKEAKIAQEKAEREAKRAQEKAEREAKKAAEKAEKEAAKTSKTSKKTDEKTETPAPAPAPAPAPTQSETPAPAPTQAKVTVSRIQIEGKHYLKSSTNILYDPNTKEEVGLWDPITKTIKDLPDEDEEEEEEEEEEEYEEE